MTNRKTPADERSMELRRVLRDREPEIEAITRCTSCPASSTFRSVDVVVPVFPVEPGSLSHITALDVIEHVQDEEAWLSALAGLLQPGGELLARVPAEGLVAWLDAPNIYRYVTEFTSRGQAPRETKPTGWHRHYGRHDLIKLVECCGLRITALSQVSAPLAEIPHLVGLLAGDLVLDKCGTEARLVKARDTFDRKDQTRSLGRLGARWRVTAIKPA